MEFEAQLKNQQQSKYRQLIVDGHESHIFIEIVQFCVANKIIFTKMSLYLTHLFQFLDVGIFGPLASYYRDGF